MTNGHLLGRIDPLVCPRCAYTPALRDDANYLGCPKCHNEIGRPVNYVVQSTPQAAAIFEQCRAASNSVGIWRWAPMLPVAVDNPVTLGEGDTPLIELSALGSRWGLDRLFLKNEAANPTWSHKDRLCAAAVTAADVLGADAVVAASTGNHGASLAAYAARAGKPCVIATLTSVPTTMRVLMEAYGARVQAVERSEERYEVIAAGVEELGWFPCSNASSPPVGSTPYGVDAYKTISYEIWSQTSGQPVDVVVVPAGYGDCLRGIARGFDDLLLAGLIDRVPRLIAAEVFNKIGQSLESGSYELGPWPSESTAAFSIAGGFTTYQAVDTIGSRNGHAVTVAEADILRTQLELARSEGIYAEASSAVAVAAVNNAYKRGLLRSDESVVVIGTSTGLKDPKSTAAALEWAKK